MIALFFPTIVFTRFVLSISYTLDLSSKRSRFSFSRSNGSFRGLSPTVTLKGAPKPWSSCFGSRLVINVGRTSASNSCPTTDSGPDDIAFFRPFLSMLFRLVSCSFRQISPLLLSLLWGTSQESKNSRSYYVQVPDSRFNSHYVWGNHIVSLSQFAALDLKNGRPALL